MTVSRWPIALAALLLLAACGTPVAQPPSPASPVPATAPAPPTAPAATAAAPPRATPGAAPVTFEEAQSVALATGEGGALLAALGVDESLFVARSEDGGRSFSAPVKASGEVKALVSRLERPALAADAGGRVVVSWLELNPSGGANIWYSLSEDGGRSFQEPVLAGRSQAHETTMVRAALVEGRPLLTWLQDGALQLVRGEGGAEPQAIDGAVCDCCQPAPLLLGERLIVAYRNVEQLSGGTARDMYVAASSDGGATFEEPVRVSDAPWYLDACPISGPAITADEQHVYVAWMDGRNDSAGRGLRGDVWLARSADGGRSFGSNVRVNPREAGYHNLPALAVDGGGRLHIAWEADEDGQASILYSTSDDGGLSFTPPRSVALETGDGRPSNAALAASADGTIALAWVDRAGAHVIAGL